MPKLEIIALYLSDARHDFAVMQSDFTATGQRASFP